MRTIFGLLTVLVFAVGLSFAQQNQTVSGEVVDSTGAFVVGASVVLIDSDGGTKTTTTNSSGRYSISNITPGTYSLIISGEGFGEYNNPEFEVKPSGNSAMDVVLTPGEINAEVDVNNEGQIDLDPNNNASALVLNEDDLKGLPDDPDDLEAALQALAGGASGPNGGQIYIDGFEGDGLPPKEAIREIRINRDQFSAEFAQPGFGRIEILTKPGALKWSGQAYFNFNDSALNARNPFSENKADVTQARYGGYISGPVIKDKASLSFSISNRDSSNGSAINATVINDSYEIVPLQEEIKEPRTRFNFGPRFDYQINENNTLVTRYEFSRNSSENLGGNFTLPSRGSTSKSSSHQIQITETAILNATTVNETRFQYRYNRSDSQGESTEPAINVLNGFLGGGSTVGLNYNKTNFWELHNYTTMALGKDSEHAVRFGVALEGNVRDDRSSSNYNGTFTFTGGLIAGRDNVYDVDGDGIISSIEQYRAKLLGATDAIYNPNQYSVTTGDPLSGISQIEWSVFAKDDWRVNPGLTISYGIRYENQTNISDNFDIAPRLSIAWSPGAGGASAPKTVFRGGFGIFYTRFSESLSLAADRLDGVTQQRYIIGNSDDLLSQPVFSLDGVTNVPTAEQLATLSPLSSTPTVISEDARAPYNMQGAFGVEQQLPGNSTLSAYYIYSKYLHLVRMRNINAPVCPSGFDCPVTDADALQALRPDPTEGNIYQYESTGYGVDNRLMVNLRSMLFQKHMVMASYSFGVSKANTDGAGGGGMFRRGGFGMISGGFPAYSYDLSDEYAYSSTDARHMLFFMSSIQAPWGISIRPMGIFRTGTPYNFIVGRDVNGDSVFMERPTFEVLGEACVANGLSYSWCDVSGYDPDATVPKNFARGDKSFTMNLSVNKTFNFGGDGGGTQPNATGGGRHRGGGMFGGGGRGRGRSSARGKYNLSIGARVRNLFNTNNLGNPNANVSSSTFGDVLGGFGGFGGGARTIEINTRFTW